ncbi:hypothetical protein [Rhodopirellula islandica]|uniref:hypothetical protein n=1 Tax=Rhodopirellula islandica TaxID=595434 RepID=UPI00136498DC|nr:hypothetical protein [Rhodopirellula islandica]
MVAATQRTTGNFHHPWPALMERDVTMAGKPTKISTATAAITPKRIESIATVLIKDSSARLLVWRRLGIE